MNFGEHSQNHSLLLVWTKAKTGIGGKMYQKLEEILPGFRDLGVERGEF